MKYDKNQPPTWQNIQHINCLRIEYVRDHEPQIHGIGTYDTGMRIRENFKMTKFG